MTTAPRGTEGEGFPVRRAFAGVSLAELDPFIHMDQMGEVDYAPGEPGHQLASASRLRDGHLHHRRLVPASGLPRRRRVIENGATQWMTAGSGILHIETPPEELVISGGRFHGLQLWVNLPSQRQDDRAAVPEPRRRPRDVALVT